MSRDDAGRRARLRHICGFRLWGLACLLMGSALLTSLTWSRVAQAQSSVLAPAPLGSKAEVVDGVPLVPESNAQRGECRTLADHLKLSVPCPGLLPDPIPVSPTTAATLCPGDYGAFGEGSCGPAAFEVNRTLLEISQSNFQVPSGYVGVSVEQNNGAVVPASSISGGPLGHFVFMSGTKLLQVMTNGRGKGGAPVPAYCSQIDSSILMRVHGHPAKLYQCGNASNSPTQIQIVEGHTLLVWREGKITCEVSFHGHSRVNVDLDLAVAKATVLVAPRVR